VEGAPESKDGFRRFPPHRQSASRVVPMTPRHWAGHARVSTW
jgi:hypothetical protein